MAKIDTNNFIPTSEAFDIISFGVAAIKQTSDGVKNSFKAHSSVSTPPSDY